MRCPVDSETLIMTERNGVEIDYCPKCRGVWLDRGELDKIIDRSMAAGSVASAPAATSFNAAPIFQPESARADATRRAGTRTRRDDDDDDHRDHKRKRRESFLGDLFDF